MNVSRHLLALSRIARTRYPGFILGLPLAAGEIPVFTYHDVEPAEFAGDLEYLRDNGYRTLSLDEYVSARSAGRGLGRCVLLTFDDARKSFWQVALPLLESFDAHAALFAPSYWMTPPVLRCAADTHEGGSQDDLFMSWRELRACVESGLVDVQSHAHRHALVPVSDQLMDFASPRALQRFDIYDWPMRHINDAEEVGRPALGTPVYRAQPLLSASRRYLENSDLTLACRRFVEQTGGPEFFLWPDWQASLRAFHRERARRMPGRFMPEAEFSRLVASEFERSREEFRSHLGYAPAYIAYPWMLGSRHSLEQARVHGLRAAFGVALDFRAERNRSHLPIPVFGRLKCDWLRFLPGRQRSTVFAAVGRKVAGFRKIEHLAH